jgi:outer membrane scaffolding protein for murein synthesis (MipA/OmpV family)
MMKFSKKGLTRVISVAVLGSMSSLAFAGGALSGVESVTPPDTKKSEKNWSGMIGAAILAKPEYWGSDETEGAGAPIIIVDYKDTAYFKIDTAGWWFWKPDANFRVGAIARFRPKAWDKSDDSIDDRKPLPNNFDDPSNTLEPGINAQYKMDRFTAQAQITSGQDINAALDLRYNIMQSKEFVVVAKLGVEFLGEDEVNYQWYGDNSNLSNDSATNLSLGLFAIQTLNEDWKLLYGVNSTLLDNEIEDSPVGDSSNYTIAFIGAAYSF